MAKAFSCTLFILCESVTVVQIPELLVHLKQVTTSARMSSDLLDKKLSQLVHQ